MKKIYKIVAVLCCLLAFGKVNAQEMDFTGVAGVGTPLLDNGFGYHFAFNPSMPIQERLFADAQISFTNTNIGSTFLTGQRVREQVIGIYLGARYYLNTEEKETRYFVNLLFGRYFGREIDESSMTEDFSSLGLTGGIYLQKKKIYIGLGFDPPQSVIFKLGYTFYSNE